MYKDINLIVFFLYVYKYSFGVFKDIDESIYITKELGEGHNISLYLEYLLTAVKINVVFYVPVYIQMRQ